MSISIILSGIKHLSYEVYRYKPFSVFAFYCLQMFLLAQSLIGNGNIVEVERDVEPFTSVSTSHGWDLILTQGNSHEMIIEADENIIPDLTTEVVSGHLKIYFKKGIKLRKAKRKKIHLTFVNLEGLNASGGSDVRAESQLKSDDLDINLSGGSDLDFGSFAVGRFSSNISGGSDVRVTFQASDEIYVNASGGSDINFKEHQRRPLRIDALRRIRRYARWSDKIHQYFRRWW